MWGFLQKSPSGGRDGLLGAIGGRGYLRVAAVLSFCTLADGVVVQMICCTNNGRILLANLLQSSISTFPWGSFLSFFTFKAGMLDTQISALGGWPTVSGRYPE
jgi:hypothetical protein